MFKTLINILFTLVLFVHQINAQIDSNQVKDSTRLPNNLINENENNEIIQQDNDTSFSVKEKNAKKKSKEEFKISIFGLEFKLEELILFVISILFSLILFLIPKKMIASYVSDDKKTFYYVYKNNLGRKTYTKRPVSGGEEIKVKSSDFKSKKESLNQRSIP